MVTFALIVIMGFTICIWYYNIHKYKLKWLDMIQDISSGMFVGVLFAAIVEINVDPRLDVYRGKTELQVKGFYRDSVFVVTDSVVVYKKQ